MDARQQEVLYVQADMIPGLRAAFAHRNRSGSTSRSPKLSRNGYLPQPWLGDETSTEVAAHYTRRAMEAPDSSYRSLQQYRAELGRVHDTLQRMEDQYLGADQRAADRHRRT